MCIRDRLYNKSSQIYAQMSQDLSLYRTLRVDMMGDQSDEIAIGMGLGIPLTCLLYTSSTPGVNKLQSWGANTAGSKYSKTRAP